MAKTILRVDDSVMVRQMVSFTLRAAGLEVVEVENGQDPLNQLAATKFIPIPMLTTESQPEMKLKRKAAGATGWMVKPFDPPKPLGVIAKVLP
jgi:two-component system chemotaxis response regulator CheY